MRHLPKLRKLDSLRYSSDGLQFHTVYSFKWKTL